MAADSKKVILLRSALRRGFLPFVRQLYLTGGEVVRKRHVIFRATAEDVLAMPRPVVEGVTFREITSLDALPEDARRRLLENLEGIEWGSPDWFSRGWRLWIAEIGGELACLGWLRNAEQSSDFFIEMPPGSELLWQVATLPEYRGQKLHVLIEIELMRARIRDGVTEFYANCREYNVSAHRNILKMGFKVVGYVDESKITSKRRWRPSAEIKTATG